MSVMTSPWTSPVGVAVERDARGAAVDLAGADDAGDGRRAGGLALLAAEGDALADDRLDRLAEGERGGDDVRVGLLGGLDVVGEVGEPAGGGGAGRS